MTTHRRWWLTCDVCGRSQGEKGDEPENFGPDVRITDGMISMKWIRNRFLHTKVQDICPQCREAR